MIGPGETYWTLLSDRIPIPDGEKRVDAIPGLVVLIDGEEVPSVTRGARVDGEAWIDRRWACQLGLLDTTPIHEGSSFMLASDAEKVESIHVRFHYRHPGGADIGYAADPVWMSHATTLKNIFGAMNEGDHDAYATVHHVDGTSRVHHFVVDFRD